MALDFDGVDDISDHGDINALDGATLLATSFWFYLDVAPPTNAGLWSKGETFGVGFTSGIADDKLGAHGALAGGQRWYSGVDRPTGVWTHVAVTYNGGGAADADRLKLAVDGVELALTFGAAVPASLASNATTVKTGKNDTNNVFCDAKIAHLKVWAGGSAMTLAQLEQERFSYRPVRTANLILWCPYDDGVQANDYSGQRNHGTVTGALQSAGPPISYGAPD